MPLTSPAFEHNRLENAEEQFRLLRISKEQGHIMCHMETFSIDVMDDRFLALSYTWDPPTPLNTIYVNGHSFSVRENLHNFLSLWPEEQDGRWVWIDQICINQNDLQERSAQVRQMERVFSTASTVLAWFGKADGHDLIFAELREQSLEGREEEALLWFDQAQMRQMRMDGAPAVLQQSGKYRELDPRIENAVTDLFTRSYWKRLWVAREIELARKLVMLYGSLTISSRYFTFLCIYVATYCAAYDGFQFAEGLGVFSMADRAGSVRKKAELQSILLNFGALVCENPRDKVYGLLAMVELRQRREITVNYDLPVELVWQNAVDVMTKWDRLVRYKDISSDDDFPPLRPPRNSRDIIAVSNLAYICENLGIHMQIPDPFIHARLKEQLQVVKVEGEWPWPQYYYVSKNGWALLPEDIENLWESLIEDTELPPWNSESFGGNDS